MFPPPRSFLAGEAEILPDADATGTVTNNKNKKR